MIDLRKFAKGKECQVRAIGICNFDPETTVLAHIRRRGVAGVGQKPHDLIAVHACSNCHDAMDGRAGIMNEISDTDLLDAVCGTLEVVGKEIA